MVKSAINHYSPSWKGKMNHLYIRTKDIFVPAGPQIMQKSEVLSWLCSTGDGGLSKGTRTS